MEGREAEYDSRRSSISRSEEVTPCKIGVCRSGRAPIGTKKDKLRRGTERASSPSEVLPGTEHSSRVTTLEPASTISTLGSAATISVEPSPGAGWTCCFSESSFELIEEGWEWCCSSWSDSLVGLWGRPATAEPPRKNC